MDQKKDTLKIKDSKLASLESEVKDSIAKATAPAPEVEVASATASNDNAASNGVQRAAQKATTSASKSNVSSSNSSASSKRTAAAPSSKNTAKAATSSNAKSPAHGGSAISAAYSVVGTPYVWGGKSPGGFDCSGLVSWAYSQAGISIPSSTAALSGYGTSVSYANAKPGDLVFFDTYKKDGHVGIYLGGGKFIGAQDSGVGVASISNPYWSKVFKGHVQRIN
ncbi:NlpC/P60 family protein [Virgibacillus sp. 179-BFC.A HS]|uniref:NlpC/P60 family protein n=1 Tax=Tigheibacillus jepli TaxID=3035914 RepID=A0ABU5CFW1_9BACI|nr:NlpC/P60 family protein [Virgibacillus sp. 179-BFC.A HS]MDY0405199.1 NlpC/P60 family protein [Virgibacillus sp. 179-BFC.A HS]